VSFAFQQLSKNILNKVDKNELPCDDSSSSVRNSVSSKQSEKIKVNERSNGFICCNCAK